MKIKLLEVRNGGDLEKERVILQVTEDGDYGKFLLAWAKRTNKKDSSISTEIRTPYWFPDGTAKANDYMVVYSKAGKRRVKTNPLKNQTHFFYLGQTRALWTGDETTPILFSIPSWQALPYAELIDDVAESAPAEAISESQT